MAVLNFPAFPSNGDTYVENGVTYTYSGVAPNGFWQADNKNVAPTPDPNILVTGTLTLANEGGVDNAIAYLTSTGLVLRGDESTVITSPFLDNAGGVVTGDVGFTNNARLGIGTTSPSDPLDISGNNPTIELDNTTTGTGGLIFSSTGVPDGAVSYNNSNDRLEVFTGDIADDPALVVDYLSYVGIGSLTPEARVEIKDDTGLQLTKSDGATKWNFIPTSQLLLTENVTGNTVLRITNDGFTGIGGDPTLFADYNKLSVFGTGITIDDAEQTGIQFSSGSTPAASIVYDHINNKALIETSDNPIIFNNVGNIGIREENPAAPLHVKGRVIVEDDSLTVIGSGSGSELNVGSQLIGTSTAHSLSLKTDAVDRVVISETGNVTATSSDSAPTFLFADSAASSQQAGAGFAVNSDSDSALRNVKLVLDASGADLVSADTFSITRTGEGNVTVDNGSGDDVTFTFGATEVAKLESDGDIIIGGGSKPINGNKVTINDDTKAGITLNTSGTNGSDIEVDAISNLIITNNEADRNIQFITGTYNQLSLIDAGAAGKQAVIGGTQRRSSADEIQLTVGDVTTTNAGIEIRGSATSTILFSDAHNSTETEHGEIRYTQNDGFSFRTPESSPTKVSITENGILRTFASPAGNVPSIFLGDGRAASGASEAIRLDSSATGVGVGGVTQLKIYTNGDIQNTNNNYGSLSDLKLKKNISDANSQWDDIKAVSLKNYEFKNPEYGTGRMLGVIAQDLQSISPGLVNETEDVLTVESPVFDDNGAPVFDDNGNQVTEIVSNKTGETTLSVKYSVLYLKAIGALQEAMTRIEELEAKVADLES